MKKVLIVATVQSHIAQFHKPLINMLKEKGFHVTACAKNNLAIKKNLTLTEPNEIIEVPFSRSPFSPKNLKAYKKLKAVIEKGEYDVVHCNTPVGGILTRLACRKLRKKGKIKVLYHAHGFHFFKGGSKKNFLLWYPIEKAFSKLTDTMVVINKMDYELAKSKFNAKNVVRVPGVGVNLNQFRNEIVDVDLRKEFNLDADTKMVLSVGELNENKNQKVIINAIAHLKDEKIHYFLAGNGPLREKLEEQAKKLKVEEKVHFLGYRRDLPAIYKQVDVFVLPSYREGLGLAAIEAMSFGLPIVTSNKHGINDYSEDGVSGFKYEPNDYKGFAEGIRKIVYDGELKEKMGEQNKETAQNFSLETYLKIMEEVYDSLIGEN